MTKTELYRSLGMDKFIWGDSFKLDVRNKNIATDDDVNSLLDNLCINEDLIPLNNQWFKMSFDKWADFLLDALNFDLMFTSVERMTKEKAIYFHQQLLSEINTTECKCFSNWNQSPWKNNDCGSYSITKNTLDMAFAILDTQNLVFIYFIGED